MSRWARARRARSRGVAGWRWRWAVPAMALDKVTFGTNWKAQAEHGGFYQAVADGTYEKYGLDVTIRPGRAAGEPHPARWPPARSTSTWAATCSSQFNFTPEQRADGHGRGDLPEGPAGPDGAPRRGRARSWPTSRARRSSSRNDGRADLLAVAASRSTASPTTRSSPTPSTRRRSSPTRTRSSRATSPPSRSRSSSEGGFDPVVLLMADFGYDTYSTTIETSQKLVDENPDLVQRFVDASIEGWYNYLYGDPTPGQRADQGGQSGDDRRADRVLDRGA